ncbi:hypothetical protein DPMN_048734 [Dreissena polymorpha]|uniref:Uncharacterized protein n=1 Tax=Dreissena polymorpha TaxID=45954 RepID=A0A9D4DBX2_DREPO|nr:hypothetical protein DPMN_048604 [Dreissena polymorpha]KAH3742004.1 hypothetical protein DPMN_048734 [Dreissena polymorpha]
MLFIKIFDFSMPTSILYASAYLLSLLVRYWSSLHVLPMNLMPTEILKLEMGLPPMKFVLEAHLHYLLKEKVEQDWEEHISLTDAH